MRSISSGKLVTIFLTALTISINAGEKENSILSTGSLSPGLAVALSLQPLPIDLGNLYTDNWRHGILYTIAEAAIAIPGIAMMGHGMGMRGSFFNNDDYRSGDHWAGREQTRFYSLLSAYIIVKTISAWEAGTYAEKEQRKSSFFLKPAPHQLSVIFSLNFK